jgi:hypothetical protein
MSYTSFTLTVSTLLFVGLLALLELGRRFGLRQRASDSDGTQAGTGAVDGAVFALLGLLIAFTFSGAASRFDDRRSLIVQETNDIGTAYLRLDLLAPDAQPALRDLFRRYVDARLEVYRLLQDVSAAKAELARANALAGQIWTRAVAAASAEGAKPGAAMLLLPALNQMFDIATTRTMAMQMHPPAVIFLLLFGLALAGALLAGYGMAAGRHRPWVHMVVFAAVVALAVYVIIDIEYPRLGLIRVDAFDQALVDLRAGMK